MREYRLLLQLTYRRTLDQYPRALPAGVPRFGLRLTPLFHCQNPKRLLPFAVGTGPIARVKSRTSLPPVTVAEPVILSICPDRSALHVQGESRKEEGGS